MVDPQFVFVFDCVFLNLIGLFKFSFLIYTFSSFRSARFTCATCANGSRRRFGRETRCADRRVRVRSGSRCIRRFRSIVCKAGYYVRERLFGWWREPPPTVRTVCQLNLVDFIIAPHFVAEHLSAFEWLAGCPRCSPGEWRFQQILCAILSELSLSSLPELDACIVNIVVVAHRTRSEV